MEVPLNRVYGLENKNYILSLICMLFLSVACGRKEAAYSYTDFGANWLFCLDAPDSCSDPDFDDSSWRMVNLPHDWMIEDKPGTDSPFVPDVENGVSSGFMVGGNAWYRKHFNASGMSGKLVSLDFDGVYMDSEIWLNGQRIGEHFYGYTPFSVDLSGMLNYEGDNVLAVRVHSPEVTSRWYSGAGIYRPVHIRVQEPLALRAGSVRITTEGESVKLCGSILNRSGNSDNAEVSVLILDSCGKSVAHTEPVTLKLDNMTESDFSLETIVDGAEFWSSGNPVLYKAQFLINGKVVGEEKFGFRTIAFAADGELLINGVPTLLRGGCVHHDHGPIGAESYPAAERRRVKLLKEAGYNAVRTSHNPQSKAFMDACDELGIMVIDEAFDVWRYGHFKSDYASRFDELWREDLRLMVSRDFNRPSVIMWSTGNEIINGDTDEIAELAAQMSGFLHELDPGRPVTSGVNAVRNKDKYLDALDVAGYNYARDRYVAGRELHPGQSIYASESYSSEMLEYWKDVEKYPWVIGDFVWTAFDYIGESSIGWYGYYLREDFFPWHVAYCGEIDVCGKRRPHSYYRESIWSGEPVLYLSTTPPVPSFPLNPQKEDWSVWDWKDDVRSWNWEGAGEVEVHAYSNCEEVELFLNGRSLGRKSADGSNIFSWTLDYEPGELSAKAWNSGTEVAADGISTTGGVCGIELIADKTVLAADGNDLCFLEVRLVDSEGRTVCDASESVTLEVSGSGSLAGFGNSDPMDVSGFTHNGKKAWRGECLAVIRSDYKPGKIQVRASTPDGKSTSITLKTK